jgi:lactate dehydrogenase-like 2-hydroxyacid dehydrogenase
MRIVYHTRHQLDPELERSLNATYVSFDELIDQADVLSLHTPLTNETRGRIDRVALGRMKRGSFLVNTSRGGLIEEPALIEALESGQLAGAGLDVTATEPDVPVALREHPRALIMPHIASATRGTRGGMMRMALENATAVLEGRTPANAVNNP